MGIYFELENLFDWIHYITKRIIFHSVVLDPENFTQKRHFSIPKLAILTWTCVFQHWKKCGKASKHKINTVLLLCTCMTRHWSFCCMGLHMAEGIIPDPWDQTSSSKSIDPINNQYLWANQCRIGPLRPQKVPKIRRKKHHFYNFLGEGPPEPPPVSRWPVHGISLGCGDCAVSKWVLPPFLDQILNPGLLSTIFIRKYRLDIGFSDRISRKGSFPTLWWKEIRNPSIQSRVMG